MPALFDPAAHESLRAEAWDENAARVACERIVTEALAAFDPVTLWPRHPRDVEPTDADRTRGYTSLYLGAAGMAWALQRLTGSSPLTPGALLEAFNAEPDLPSMHHGLLLGDVGVSLVAFELGGDAHADRLEAAIHDAIPRAERELLWAAPGAVHASLAALELTGDQRWRACARDAVDELWATLDPPDARGLRVWTQDLYGREQRLLGLGHGFAGNAHALLRAGDLLGDARRAQLVEIAAGLLDATAVWDDGAANWPADLDRDEPLRRLQICHGAPGIVVGLASIPAGEQPRLDELLVAAGEATWRAGPIARGPGLCHGTAGNGYAFLKLWERTGDERWLERARAFAMHALGQCERERDAVRHGRHALWTGDMILPFFTGACITAESAVFGLDVL